MKEALASIGVDVANSLTIKYVYNRDFRKEANGIRLFTRWR